MDDRPGVQVLRGRRARDTYRAGTLVNVKTCLRWTEHRCFASYEKYYRGFQNAVLSVVEVYAK